MTPEQIEKFFTQLDNRDTPVKISFRTRNAVTGVFVLTPDFQELKTKNFWRIVSVADLKKWKQSNDYSVCRMFNGVEFTKLQAVA